MTVKLTEADLARLREYVAAMPTKQPVRLDRRARRAYARALKKANRQ